MIVSAVVLDVLEIYLNLDGIWDRHYHEVGHYFNLDTFGKELGANVCTPSNLTKLQTPQWYFGGPTCTWVQYQVAYLAKKSH
jgi:hypothetical protein